MARKRRVALGGFVYHVLNRANDHATLFSSRRDYQAFERILAQGIQRFGMRLLTYCLMPTHWHLLLWPREDGQLSEFTGWISMTHAQRRHAHRQTIGSGHLYQGRFKSFPIQEDGHFITVARYVERNPVRKNLVSRAEEWPWSGLWVREHHASKVPLHHDWPVPRPTPWIPFVNQPQTPAEENAIRNAIHRGIPYGESQWIQQTAKTLGIPLSSRPRGRPKKGS